MAARARNPFAQSSRAARFVIVVIVARASEANCPRTEHAMKIVLVGAEFEENLAVRYLRGALERAGHDVTQVVFNEASDTEKAARCIVDSGAPLTGMSMVFTHRARQFARLAERARELGYRGHIVAGGHFAAFHPLELLGDVAAIDSVA